MSAESEARDARRSSLAGERERWRGLVALVWVQVFYGLFAPFVKLTTDQPGGFEPRAVWVWRVLAASLVLGGAAWLRHGRDFFVTRKELLGLGACSLLGVTLNQVMALEGVARTSVIQAGLLMTLIPVFTYALAVLVRQETLRWDRVLGFAVAMSGALVLVLLRAGGALSGTRPLVGNLLIVANTLSYAGYLVLAHRILQRRPTLVVIAWVFLLSLWTLPIVAWGVPLVPADAEPRAWTGLALTLVFPTVLAYSINAYALARVSASTTAFFVYLQPLVATLGAMLLFGERPGAVVFLGAALLFTGIFLVSRRER